MGYEMANGRYAATRDVNLLPSGPATLTATGVSTGVETGDVNNLRLKLDVTAASGTTPSLTVTVETSYDNGVTDAWRSLGSFAAKTAVSSERKTFPGADRWVRLNSTVSGTTPSLTFTCQGESGC